MRNLLLAGTAGLFLAFGAASAYAVPQNSPYATMVPPAAVDGYTPDGSAYACPGDSAQVGCPDGMVEGRAAVVDPDYAYGDPAYIAPAFGFGYGGFGYGGGFRGNGGHFAGGHFGGGFRHGR
jgi:hypothetical protein